MPQRGGHGGLTADGDEVRGDEPGRALGDRLEVDAVGGRDVGQQTAQQLGAGPQVGQRAGRARGRRGRGRAGGGRPTRVPRVVATSARCGVATAARRASSTRVASGGGSAAGSRASTSVSSRTTGASGRAAARASRPRRARGWTRRPARGRRWRGPRARRTGRRRRPRRCARGSSCPTPSGPTTSTPSRGEPPSRVSSSGRRKVSSSHSTRRRAASAWPTRSSMSSAGSAIEAPSDGAGTDVLPAAAGFAATGGHTAMRSEQGHPAAMRRRRRPAEADHPATARARRRRCLTACDRRSAAAMLQSPRTVALPADHRRRHHRHRARGLGARHRQQLGRPRPADRTGQPPARGRDVQARRGLDVLRQERDRVAAGHDLADQREARRLRGQGGPRQPGAGQQHPAGGGHLRGRDHHRRALGQPGVGEDDVVHRRLARRDTGRRRRGERGGLAGAGQAHRVPGAQAERVEHLRMQTDHAAAGVGRRRSDPDDEGDAGVGHPATLSGRSVAGVPQRRRAAPAARAAAPVGAARRGAVRRPGRGGAASAGRAVVRPEDRARHVPRAPRDPAPQRRPQAEPPRRPRRPATARRSRVGTSHASGCRLSHSKR